MSEMLGVPGSRAPGPSITSELLTPMANQPLMSVGCTLPDPWNAW